MQNQGSNIASHFANCEVNFSYCNCKVLNETNVMQFFSQEKLIHSHYIFPHYIQTISTFYWAVAYYYQKKYCLCPKLHHKMQKMHFNSLQKTFACGGLNPLQCEFQTITRTLKIINQNINIESKYDRVFLNFWSRGFCHSSTKNAAHCKINEIYGQNCKKLRETLQEQNYGAKPWLKNKKLITHAYIYKPQTILVK